MKTERIEQISDMTKSVLKGTDIFLIDVEIKGAREPVVWVYVDAPDRGVNMDECANISNEVGLLIDAHEVFTGTYRLNVSSPGLSRPLTDRRQYGKNKGRKARIKYKTNDEYRKVEGVLAEVSEEKVVVETDNGSVPITFDEIVETKIIPVIK